MAAAQDTSANADRLALLLIAQPRKGWEREFEELIRREVDRIVFLRERTDGEDDE